MIPVFVAMAFLVSGSVSGWSITGSRTFPTKAACEAALASPDYFKMKPYNGQPTNGTMFVYCVQGWTRSVGSTVK